MRYTIIIAVFLIAGITGCGGHEEQVMIFHADALTVPLSRLAIEYQRRNPGARIITEGHGSRICIDLAKQRSCDLLMVADARLLSDTTGGFWSWNAIFASNEVVIAYSERAKYANEINADNWYRILTRPDVRFVHANPETDPVGWWTLLLWQLADDYYGETVNGIKISEALAAMERHDTVKQGANQVVRMLNIPSGIDYGFLYRNQAMEHKLQFIELPREINLSDPSLNDHYATASLPPPLERHGAAIAFSFTMLNNAPNREATLRFLEFMFSDEGKALIRGPARTPEFNIIDPPKIENPEKMSHEVRRILLP